MVNIEEKLNRLTHKKEILDSQKPLKEDVIRDIEEWLTVELTYSSNAIEGNTLTRIQTAEIIEKGISAILKNRPLKDQLEAINHANAVDYIRRLAKDKKSHQTITQDEIRNIHKIILTSINDEWAGRYRQSEVFVKGSQVEFPLPQNVPYHMQEFTQWLESQQGIHPVQVAADAHFKLVSIHPFVDGNGRTARLLMNLILLINGYPMAIIRNEDRTGYLEAVNFGQTQNDLKMYYSLMLESVERTLDAYVSAARGKPAMPILMGDDKPTKLLKIGEIAKLTHETKATIRFWTNEELLEVARTTKSGYALYSPQMIERVGEIRRLQNEKRLTISEIKGTLDRSVNCDTER